MAPKKRPAATEMKSKEEESKHAKTENPPKKPSKLKEPSTSKESKEVSLKNACSGFDGFMLISDIIGFNVKEMYERIHGKPVMVKWCKLILPVDVWPRHAFMFWLVTLGKL
ncbi:hypothetical protein Droror1_Dr00020899 [Drosera rotundifolia]